jgi:hypothetical protein
MVQYEAEEQVWYYCYHPVTKAKRSEFHQMFGVGKDLPAKEVCELDGCPSRPPDLNVRMFSRETTRIEYGIFTKRHSLDKLMTQSQRTTASAAKYTG